ncbi:MAG TPA: DUF4126 domain-containing protein [Acidimicrobiia bacterium]|nr:DUF4126 domain-containing protein [Acidimicrobiia bacterium]
MLETIGLLTGSGWAAGLNLYLVTFLLGLAGRLDWIEVPAVLQRTDVMIAAGVLYGVEFLADKVPYLDNVWDAIHTVVRPLGAGALGYVIAGDSPSVGAAVGALVSGSLALTAHSAKATTRAAVNTSPEPFSNIVLSLFEDGLVAGLVALAITNPWVTIVVVLILTGLAVWLTLKLFGAIRRIRARWAGRSGLPEKSGP